MARELGVHPSTISRDLAAIRPTLVLPDPCCVWHAKAKAIRRAQERAEVATWAKLARFGVRSPGR